MSIKRGYLLVLIVIVLGVLSVAFWKLREPPPLGVAPSWQGVVLGETRAQALITLWGEPDHIEERGDYRVYSYGSRQIGGWQRIELWTETADPNQTIVAMLRTYPETQLVNGRVRSLADLSTLDQVVLLYGQPEEVTWGVFCLERYLMWPRQGVAVGAYAYVTQFSWEELGVSEVLLFEPMNLRAFLNTEWPWPTYGVGWAGHNLCTNTTTDAPDRFPEDPYDWEYMPTPQP